MRGRAGTMDPRTALSKIIPFRLPPCSVVTATTGEVSVRRSWYVSAGDIGALRRVPRGSGEMDDHSDVAEGVERRYGRFSLDHQTRGVARVRFEEQRAGPAVLRHHERHDAARGHELVAEVEGRGCGVRVHRGDDRIL